MEEKEVMRRKEVSFLPQERRITRRVLSLFLLRLGTTRRVLSAVYGPRSRVKEKE